MRQQWTSLVWSVVACGGVVACGEVETPAVDAAVTIDAAADASQDAPPDAAPGACAIDNGGCGTGQCTTVAGGASCSISLVISAATMNYNVAVAAGNPTRAISVSLQIQNVLVGSTSTASAALTTGALPTGSTFTLTNAGSIIGAGGAGGSGGNGGGGGTPRSCSRDGLPGGPAISLTLNATISNTGSIFGGGGGGAGMSGCNVNGGGGGGAGSTGGAGGVGASTLTNPQELVYCGQDNAVRTGVAGSAGSTTGGVGAPVSAAIATDVGDGGGYGLPGVTTTGCVTSTGLAPGAAGNAIKRNSFTVNIANGAYATGTGPIRGPVN